MQRITKSWGFEEILENGPYCMKLLIYTKPISSSLHYHERKSETFYVASGAFLLELDDEKAQAFNAGSAISIPAGTRHRVRCVVPGVIVEASTHDDPDDCIRLVPSES